MDLATLNAFIAVAELGSFSEAAERLHLTQPAVSKRIASLEQQLNVRLFDRLGREVSLTEAGRALLPRAYQILNVLDDTRRALTNLNGEISGRLTLATSHHIGLHRLPPLLRAFTRAYPRVALDIQFLDSEVAYEEVLHGRAELAVITLAPETREPVHAVKVWGDPLDFVAAPEHPLACMDSVAMLFVALMLPFVALPPLDIWPWILASAAFELLYRYLLIQAYRVGDLGLVYPLMRGLSPLVVLAQGSTRALLGSVPAVLLGSLLAGKITGRWIQIGLALVLMVAGVKVLA